MFSINPTYPKNFKEYGFLIVNLILLPFYTTASLLTHHELYSQLDSIRLSPNFYSYVTTAAYCYKIYQDSDSTVANVTDYCDKVLHKA
jgi:hypothetical protein